VYIVALYVIIHVPHGTLHNKLSRMEGIPSIRVFLQYGAMGYPLDGGSNENKFLKSCALHSWVLTCLLLGTGTECRGVHNVDGYCSFSLESYNLYSIASQLKRVIDPVTSGILNVGVVYY